MLEKFSVECYLAFAYYCQENENSITIIFCSSFYCILTLAYHIKVIIVCWAFRQRKAFLKLSVVGVNIFLLSDKPTITVFHLKVQFFLYQGYLLELTISI